MQLSVIIVSYNVCDFLIQCLDSVMRACGKLEAPGRPTLYATTDAFLRVMGIETLQQLPPLPEVQGSEGTEQLRKSIAKIQEQDSEQQTFFDDTETKNTGA